MLQLTFKWNWMRYYLSYYVNLYFVHAVNVYVVIFSFIKCHKIFIVPKNFVVFNKLFVQHRRIFQERIRKIETLINKWTYYLKCGICSKYITKVEFDLLISNPWTVTISNVTKQTSKSLALLKLLSSTTLMFICINFIFLYYV